MCPARAALAGNPSDGYGGLGRAMARTFEIRSMLVDIDPATTRLVEIAQHSRAAANSAGSGGSIIGLARDADHVERLGVAYRSEGFGFLDLA